MNTRRTVYRFLILVAYLFCSFSIYSQNLTAVNKEESPSKRFSWVYDQRAFPLVYVPSNVTSDLSNANRKLITSSGYFAPRSFWTCIGPLPGNLGGSISYDITGRVGAAAFYPGDPTGMTVMIGGAEGGLWKSTDGGLNWVPKTDNLGSLSTGAIAYGQNEKGSWTNLYYGTGESHAGFNFCYYGDGFYKSTDNGETWRHIDDPKLPKRPTYFSRIAVNPLSPNVILAACGTNHTNISYEAGLYISTDYGESWKRILPDPSIQPEGRVCNDVVFSPVREPNGNQMVYAVGPNEVSSVIYEKGIHYQMSTDGGFSWTMRDDLLTLPGRTLVALCHDSPDHVYVFGRYETNCPPSGIGYGAQMYLSTDKGYSFRPGWSSVGVGCDGGLGDAYQLWYDIVLQVSPVNPNDVFVGLVNLYKSSDGGMTFPLSITPTHRDMQCMDIALSNPDHIIVGGDGGVYGSFSSPLGNIENFNNGTIALTQFYRIASCPFDPEIIVGGAQDNGVQSKNRGLLSWRAAYGGGDGTAALYSKINPNLIFGGYGNSPASIIRSTNGGQEFGDNFVPPDQIWDSQNDWVQPIASSVDNFTFRETFFTARRCLVNNDPNCQSGSRNKIKIFHTTDNGNTWNDFGVGICTDESPQELAISNSNPLIMYLSTGSYAWPYVSQNFYKSIDGGSSWNKIVQGSSSPDLPNRYLTHIEISPSDPNELFVTMSGFGSTTPAHPGHIFRSVDGGANWRDISGTLPDVPVNDLCIIYGDQRIFIAATDVGVFATYDGAASWEPLATGLPNSVIQDIEYNPFAGTIRAATHGRGVWECSLLNMIPHVSYPLLLNSNQYGLKIESDIIVEKGGCLNIPFTCSIKMAEGRKIIVREGGKINVGINANVVFTSQTGKWGGIYFENPAGELKNAKFSNTETPVTITNDRTKRNESEFHITGCEFEGGHLSLNNAENVVISSSAFESSGSRFALAVANSKGVDIEENHITGYPIGLLISGSNVNIRNNVLNWKPGHNGGPLAAISFDNSVVNEIAGNIINGYEAQYTYMNSIPGSQSLSFKDINDGIGKQESFSKTGTKSVENIKSIPQLIRIFDKKTVLDSINNFMAALSHSIDQNEIKILSLKVIESYMLLEDWNTEARTDKGLKPLNIEDGFRMIAEKIFGKAENSNVTINIPTEFRLDQNYPNPFNPITTIRFQLPKDLNVTIRIFDILGREVTTIFNNELLKAGDHSVIWNAENSASGVYFYEINAGEFMDLRKMVLVK